MSLTGGTKICKSSVTIANASKRSPYAEPKVGQCSLLVTENSRLTGLRIEKNDIAIVGAGSSLG